MKNNVIDRFKRFRSKIERKTTIEASYKFIRDAKELPDYIKDNTIILIGPMGTGKTTVAKELEKMTGRRRISLDDKKTFEDIYRLKECECPRDTEFRLTGAILSHLPYPCIIDFGAGHSVYDDEELKIQMEEICKNFKNIILLLPSQDQEQSEKILFKRLESRGNLNSRVEDDNRHFIEAPNNGELANYIIYECEENQGRKNEKTAKNIANEILELTNPKKLPSYNLKKWTEEERNFYGSKTINNQPQINNEQEQEK